MQLDEQSIFKAWTSLVNKCQSFTKLNLIDKQADILSKKDTYLNTSLIQWLLYKYLRFQTYDPVLHDSLLVYSYNYIGEHPKFYSLLTSELSQSKLIQKYSRDGKISFLINYIKSCSSGLHEISISTIKLLLISIKPNQKLILDLFNVLLGLKDVDDKKFIVQKVKIDFRSYLLILLVESCLHAARKNKGLDDTGFLTIKGGCILFFKYLASSSKKQDEAFLRNLITTCFDLILSDHIYVYGILHTIMLSVDEQTNVKKSSEHLLKIYNHFIQELCKQHLKHYINFHPVKNNNNLKINCLVCQEKNRKGIRYRLYQKDEQEVFLDFCNKCRISDTPELQKITKLKISDYSVFDLFPLLFSRTEDNNEQQQKRREEALREYFAPACLQKQSEIKACKVLIDKIRGTVIPSESNPTSTQNLIKRAFVFNFQIFNIKQWMQASEIFWLERYSDSGVRNKSEMLKKYPFTDLYKFSDYFKYPQHLAIILERGSTLLLNDTREVNQFIRKESLRNIVDILSKSTYDKDQFLDAMHRCTRDISLVVRKTAVIQICNIIVKRFISIIPDTFLEIFKSCLESLEGASEFFIRDVENALFKIMNSIHRPAYLEMVERLVGDISQSTTKNFISLIVYNNKNIHNNTTNNNNKTKNNKNKNKNNKRIHGNAKEINFTLDELNILAGQKNKPIDSRYSYFIKELATLQPKYLQKINTSLIYTVKKRLENSEDSTIQQDIATANFMEALFVFLADEDASLSLDQREALQLYHKIKQILLVSYSKSTIPWTIRLYMKLTNKFNDLKNVMKIYNGQFEKINTFMKTIKPTPQQSQDICRIIFIVTHFKIAYLQQSAAKNFFEQSQVLYRMLQIIAIKHYGIVKHMAINSLVKFWPYDFRFFTKLSFKPEILINVSNSTPNNIIAIYQNLQKLITKHIELADDSGVGVLTDFFQKTYPNLYKSRNNRIAALIISTMEKLFHFGTISIHNNSVIVFSYLCHVDEEVRKIANRVVKSLWNDLMFIDFDRVLTEIIIYIEMTYNKKIVLGAQDKHGNSDLKKGFFDVFIKQSQNITVKAKKQLQSDDSDFHSFYFHLCSQFNNDRNLGTSQIFDKKVQFFCRLVLRTARFNHDDYHKILEELNRMYTNNSYAIYCFGKKYFNKPLDEEEIQQLEKVGKKRSSIKNIKAPVDPVYSKPNATTRANFIINPVKACELFYLVKKALEKMKSPGILKQLRENGARKQTVKSMIETRSVEVEIPSDPEKIYTYLFNDQELVSQYFDKDDTLSVMTANRGGTRGKGKGRGGGGRSQGISQGKSQGRSQGKGRSRSQSRSQGASVSRGRGTGRGREKGTNQERSQDVSQEASQSISQSVSQGTSVSKSKGKSRGAGKGRGRGVSQGRSQSISQKPSQQPSKNRGKGKGRGRGASQGRGATSKQSRSISPSPHSKKPGNKVSKNTNNLNRRSKSTYNDESDNATSLSQRAITVTSRQASEDQYTSTNNDKFVVEERKERTPKFKSVVYKMNQRNMKNSPPRKSPRLMINARRNKKVGFSKP